MSAAPCRTDREYVSWLRCPACRGRLSEGTSVLSCPACKKAYNIRNGIPCFIEARYDFDKKCQGLADEIIRAARDSSLDEAVRGLGGSSWYDSVGRGCAVALADIGRDSVVLDIGAGTGPLSFAAAPLVRQVISLDATFSFVEFMRIRADEEGLKNVLPVYSDLKNIPLDHGSADLVILNGVLEWLPAFYGGGGPEEVQIECLRHINRYLKPGGMIYLAIENRFGLKYWFGAKDEHTGLRWVTVLPRPLADLYHIIRHRAPYRNYTHSPSGLRRLFDRSGFDAVRMYTPVPDYRNIRYLIDFSGMGPAEFLRDVVFMTDGARFESVDRRAFGPAGWFIMKVFKQGAGSSIIAIAAKRA